MNPALRFAIRQSSSSQLFDEELDRLLRETAKENSQVAATLREARGISEEMIRRGESNPV